MSCPAIPLARQPPCWGKAGHRYIAGKLSNTPENLVKWIMDPQDVDPGNAMPDLGVEEQRARDIAAYLQSLGDE